MILSPEQKQITSFEWFLNNITNQADFDEWWCLMSALNHSFNCSIIEGKIKPCFSTGQLLQDPRQRSIAWTRNFVLVKPRKFYDPSEEEHDDLLRTVENLIAYTTGDVIFLNVLEDAFNGVCKTRHWISADNQEAVKSRLRPIRPKINLDWREDAEAMFGMVLPPSVYDAPIYPTVPPQELAEVVESFVYYVVGQRNSASMMNSWVEALSKMTNNIITGFSLIKSPDNFDTTLQFNTSYHTYINITLSSDFFMNN